MRTVQLLRKLDPAAWGGTEMAMHRLFDGLLQHGVKTIVYCPRLENDAVLTCNAKEAALLEEQMPSKRIVVQPHGIDPRMFEGDHRAAARRAYPEIAGRTVLLSLGRVDPIKNQTWLLDRVPDILVLHP